MFDKIHHWFRTYTASFLNDDTNYSLAIQTKIDHSLRTADLTADIAFHENLSPEEIEIARITGLLHDIGRFEQYRKFHTFSDHKSVNHGRLGADILIQNNCLSDLNPRHQTKILKGVQYHNCCDLPADESPDILALLRIIRDADKIDILDLTTNCFYQKGSGGHNPMLDLDIREYNTINDCIFNRITAGKQALMKDVQTLNDFKALQMSWIFDVNYKRSFDIMEKRQALRQIYETMPADDSRARAVYDSTCFYLEQHLQTATPLS